jgi:hypothetical protein
MDGPAAEQQEAGTNGPRTGNKVFANKFRNGDFGAAKMRFDEGEERREGGMCSNGLPDLLSTWRA